jgi:hypothetical protein
MGLFLAFLEPKKFKIHINIKSLSNVFFQFLGLAHILNNKWGYAFQRVQTFKELC